MLAESPSVPEVADEIAKPEKGQDWPQTPQVAPLMPLKLQAELRNLQIALIKTQVEMIEQGRKVVLLFEGRDGAGKDGVIRTLTQHLNPRMTRTIALPKPSDREVTQWYFQRFVQHLPAGGELTIFNRSWYNRAGVERVMGFCNDRDYDNFLRDARRFEHMLVDSDITLIKIWLDITKEEQAKRLTSRREDPLKRFKLSAIDLEAQSKWDDYTQARNAMLKATHSKFGPWHVVATDAKPVQRLNTLRLIVELLNPEMRTSDEAVSYGLPDPEIVFLADKPKRQLAQ